MIATDGALKMRRWLVPAVTAVTVGVLAWAFLPQRRVAQRVAAPPEMLVQEVQALRGEVGRLRAEGQPKVYILPTTPAGEPVATAPAENAPSEQPPERTPEQRQKEAADAMEVKFESEPIDAAWSVKMVRDIRDAISSAAPATRVLQASCATSLCRVVLGHDAEDDQRGVATQVAAVKPFQEGVFYDYDHAPNALKTTLYVVRQGYSFRD